MTARWTGEVIGHRGAAGLAPENTVAAFETAIALGCDRIELDVRLAAGGLPVVFHDHSLDRLGPALADGERARPLSQVSVAELARLDVGARLGRPGCFVPTLPEVLDLLAGRIALNVEVKGGGGFGLRTGELVAAALRERGLGNTTIVSSFHPRVIEHVGEVAPEIPRALIAGRDQGDGALDRALAAGCTGLHPHRTLVDDALVTSCARAGLAVRAWTVNEPEDIRHLMALGVDGIVSDHPDRVLELAGRA